MRLELCIEIERDDFFPNRFVLRHEVLMKRMRPVNFQTFSIGKTYDQSNIEAFAASGKIFTASES